MQFSLYGTSSFALVMSVADLLGSLSQTVGEVKNGMVSAVARRMLPKFGKDPILLQGCSSNASESRCRSRSVPGLTSCLCESCALAFDTAHQNQ